jgi:hypothetical protein
MAPLSCANLGMDHSCSLRCSITIRCEKSKEGQEMVMHLPAASSFVVAQVVKDAEARRQ